MKSEAVLMLHEPCRSVAAYGTLAKIRSNVLYEHTKLVISSWDNRAHIERKAPAKGHVAICTVIVEIREVRLYEEISTVISKYDRSSN